MICIYQHVIIAFYNVLTLLPHLIIFNSVIKIFGRKNNKFWCCISLSKNYCEYFLLKVQCITMSFSQDIKQLKYLYQWLKAWSAHVCCLFTELCAKTSFLILCCFSMLCKIFLYLRYTCIFLFVNVVVSGVILRKGVLCI